MRLAGCQREMDRQAIGVQHCVNLAGQAASRTTHILMIVVCDTSSVLMHTHDGGIHDLVPDASLPPPNESIVIGGAGTIGFWQVAPWRTRAQDPKDAIEHATFI